MSVLTRNDLKIHIRFYYCRLNETNLQLRIVWDVFHIKFIFQYEFVVKFTDNDAQKIEEILRNV